MATTAADSRPYSPARRVRSATLSSNVARTASLPSSNSLQNKTQRHSNCPYKDKKVHSPFLLGREAGSLRGVVSLGADARQFLTQLLGSCGEAVSLGDDGGFGGCELGGLLRPESRRFRELLTVNKTSELQLPIRE